MAEAVRRRSAGDRSAVRARVRPPEPAGRRTCSSTSRRRPRTAAVTRCATPTAMRSDGRAIAKVGGEGRDSIVVGRPPDLRVFTMPGGGSVAAISFLGVDLALLLRQTTAAGDVVGVFRLDTSSGALTPLVAATPAAEWAGVTGWCDGPDRRCGGLFGTVGCAVDEPACPGGSAPPCLIYYAKVDADDTVEDRGVRARRERGHDHQARRRQPRSVLHRSPSAGLGKLCRNVHALPESVRRRSSGSVRSLPAKRSPGVPTVGDSPCTTSGII